MPAVLGRRKLLFSVLRMTLLSLTAAAGTITAFYWVVLQIHRERLSEFAQTQSWLLTNLAAQQRGSGERVPDMPPLAVPPEDDGTRPTAVPAAPPVRPSNPRRILEEFRKAYPRISGVGDSAVLWLVSEVETEPRLLLIAGADETEIVDGPVPIHRYFGGDFVSAALRGQAHSAFGTRADGRAVLAAYAPVTRLSWAVIVTLDLDEVRRPFWQAAGIAGASGLIVILFAWAFLSWSGPLLTRLEATELLSREIVHQATDGIVTMDDVGRILSFNAAAERMFGYTANEVLGKPIGLLLPSEEDAGPSLSTIRSGEGQGKRKDGTLFAVHQGSSEVEFDHVLTRTLILRDVSRQKSDERSLRSYAARLEGINRELVAAKRRADEAMQAKSGFLANMSHEIRTPLNAILGLTELALADGDATPPQDVRRTLVSVRSAAGNLLRMVNDILDYSKLEAQRMELETVGFSLRRVVAETVAIYRPAAENKGLRLRATVSDDVPEQLFGDPGRLRQVLSNLLDNALKFTAVGGIEVAFEADDPVGDHVRIRGTVRDTGIGIPPEKQQAIFEAFTQADGSTTRRYGGTGLGLSIIAQLVQLMGGEIRVRSAVGQGSTFTFTVDLALDADPDTSIIDLPAGGLKAAMAALETPPPHTPPTGTAVLPSEEDWPAPAAEVPAESEPFSGSEPAATDERPGDAHALFPRQARSESEILQPAAVLDLPTGADLPTGRILLAEDHPVNREVALGWLRRWRQHVSTAADGRAALDALREHEFDLALVDVQMPELDGIEAVRRFREFEGVARPGRRLPIVAMTAHTSQADRAACLAAGMDEFLPKPVRPQALQETLARFLPRAGHVPAPSLPPRAGQAPAPSPAAPPSPVPGTPVESERGVVWNRATALAQCGGDPAVLQDIADLFLEATPGHREALTAALERGDAIAVGRAAHALRGSAGYFGAERTVAAARRVEAAAKLPDPAALRDAADGLAEALDELTAALHACSPLRTADDRRAYDA